MSTICPRLCKVFTGSENTVKSDIFSDYTDSVVAQMLALNFGSGSEGDCNISEIIKTHSGIKPAGKKVKNIRLLWYVLGFQGEQIQRSEVTTASVWPCWGRFLFAFSLTAKMLVHLKIMCCHYPVLLTTVYFKDRLMWTLEKCCCLNTKQASRASNDLLLKTYCEQSLKK